MPSGDSVSLVHEVRRLFVDAPPSWLRPLQRLAWARTERPSDPSFVWIGEDVDGTLWRFSGMKDGWSRRVPYLGRRAWLREVSSTMACDPAFRLPADASALLAQAQGMGRATP